MPKKSFKGLPTVKKFVARLTKTGKLSTYYQRYHTNPFKRDRVPSDARKGKSVITDNELANNYGKALKFGVKSDKGLMFKDWISTLRVYNGTIGGVHTIDKISNKIKTIDDAKVFVSDVFNPINKNGLFNSDNIKNNITLLKEFGAFFNKTSKPEMYDIYIDGIYNNAEKMSDTALGSMLASFQNYDTVSAAIASKGKSEAYTLDTFNADFSILGKNPIFHILNYCQYDIFSNIKHIMNSYNGYINNLKYLQNNSVLDNKTKEVIKIYIDKLNSNIPNKDLYMHMFVELDTDVAVLMYKNKINMTIPFIFSPIIELYDEDYDLLNDNFKEIKTIDIENTLPIDLVESKFVLEKDSKTVYLYMKYKTNTSDKTFIYIPDVDKINDISKDVVNVLSDDSISEKYIKDKSDDIISNLNNNIKKNRYLVINWMS